MVAIVTGASWAIAGCATSSKPATMAAAPHEVAQQHLPLHKAYNCSKSKPFRAIICSRSQDEQGDEEVHAATAAAAPCSFGLGRRTGLASCLLAALGLSFSPAPAEAAILEADDDVELLERVKEDRKKRLQKQGIISSSTTETGYLQELIYKLSKVGQAIDKNDLPAASAVLGPNTSAQWVQNTNTAFSKLSSSPEERNEVETFNSSLASLFTSVSKRDVESSKSAFVSSATALEKWVGLAGLGGQLKGL